MSEPVANLLEVLASAQDHTPPDVAAWFDRAIGTWMENGGTLDQHLGLAAAGDGKRSARTQYRAQKRNRYLREAWNVLDGPPTPRARKLAEAIKAFETRYWPAWCDHDEPPPGASQLRTSLFRARQHGELPGERRLFDLFKGSNAASSDAWFSQRLV